MSSQLSILVPTLGRSPLLRQAVEALRRDAGQGADILVVAQGPAATAPLEGAPARVLECPEPLGFAAACNLGLRETRGELVALVNDDVLIEPGWCAALVEAIGRLGAVAVQGTVLSLEDPDRLDGLGVGWNGWGQAVQIGHGRSTPPSGDEVEIFGVSATAAIFRRDRLQAAAADSGWIFDPRLGSYYEDVDLAARLRALGERAFLIPAARCGHAGSLTGRGLPGGGLPLIYGNRHLVLAKTLGRSYWPRAPLFLIRDALDLGRRMLSRQPGAALGIVRGWGRAASRLGRFGHLGPAAPPWRELQRFPSQGLGAEP